ncbi:MAG TPA: GNAT family N-acetyltransferase [Candidatus Bathyarchaeia archaeon]|nr:GNAT family N-acetyltransferase [Candidatus Bathyarchaeia archaeon]
MTDVRILSDPHASEALKQVVVDHLDTYNVAVTGLSEYSPVNLFLQDGSQEVVGGLLALIWGGVMYVRILWVAAALRGQGHGGRLLEVAEQRAVERGCRHVFLDSFSFQAPGFYEKHGYTVWAKVDDWPAGHSHYFLRKDLPAAQ